MFRYSATPVYLLPNTRKVAVVLCCCHITRALSLTHAQTYERYSRAAENYLCSP